MTGAPESALAAELIGVSKRYLNVTALTEVDIQIAPGEVRALLGKNGAGKSTLIRMLSGAETPDVGDVHLGGRPLGTGGVSRARTLGVRTVYQELTLIGTMSVAENMFMGHWPRGASGLDRRVMAERTGEALARLDLSLDPWALVSSLSIADQQLVEIARALKDAPSLLILDEPTSSLAAAEVAKVLGAVRSVSAAGVAVVYVSHRLGEIREVAHSATVMRDGAVVATSPLAKTTTRDIVRMMLGNTAEDAQAVSSPTTDDAPVVLSASHLRIDPKIVDVSLELRRGEVVGLAGVLGSGRTELLQALAGIVVPQAGRITVGGEDISGAGMARALRAGIGLTPENRKQDGIFPFLGVDENMIVSDFSAVSHNGVIDTARLGSAARRLIDRMAIKTARPGTEIGTLSGGNQQKAVIGRWLHADSQILLLDEPTRGIDVEAKAQIYALVRGLVAGGKTVVFVSSEMEELPPVCDRILVLRGGRVVAEHRAPHHDLDEVVASAMAEH